MEYVIALGGATLLLLVLTALNKALPAQSGDLSAGLSLIVWAGCVAACIICVGGRGASDREICLLAEAALLGALLLFCGFASDRMSGKQPLFERWTLWQSVDYAIDHDTVHKPQSVMGDIGAVIVVALIMAVLPGLMRSTPGHGPVPPAKLHGQSAPAASPTVIENPPVEQTEVKKESHQPSAQQKPGVVSRTGHHHHPIKHSQHK
jgi:hypothetical protein